MNVKTSEVFQKTRELLRNMLTFSE